MKDRSLSAEFTPLAIAMESAVSTLRRMSADVSATGMEPRVPQKRTRISCS